MLSERETRRLHEIELQFRLNDPRLVRRFAVLHQVVPTSPRAGGLLAGLAGAGSRSVHGAGPLPSALLALSLLVLLAGAIAVNVPAVIAGTVLAAVALATAATVSRPRPGTA
ncbi:hypothetical protein WIS52_31220 [Pseudonocardia nematodicida]|uniref:DUF3040 domain-containing protein n=1 Tax=Pseudonocardia nematodicida TaxID=1206997 RepID=A0ABV1KMN8_9PSEU